MVAIKTAAENKISVAADECEFPFGCSNLIIELFIEPHFSHPISLFVLHVSNNLHDDPFHGHRNKKRFSSIEIRVHFMEMYPSVSAIIEIRSDILRRNQDCRREREDVDQFLDSRSIDLAEFQHRWKPYSSTPSIQFP